MNYGTKVLAGQGIIAMGDSFTEGAGASDTTHWYINRLAAFVGGPISNIGVSGTGVLAAAAAGLAAMPVNRKRLVTMLAGFNDVGRAGASSYAKITSSTRAIIAGGFLQEAIPASAMTRTGIWNALPSSLGGKASSLGGSGLYTIDSAARLTWSFFGETLVVGAFTQVLGGSYKDFWVQIDGGAQQSYTSLGLCNEAYPATSFNALVLRNLGYAPHTVTITPSVSGAYTSIDYVGRLIDPLASAAMMIGDVPNRTTWVQSGNTIDQGISNGATAALQSAIAEFPEYPVISIPVNSFYTLPAGGAADGWHPNDLGHLQICNAFKSRISLW